VAPPRLVGEAQMDAFVAADRSMLELANSLVYWSEALGFAGPAFRSLDLEYYHVQFLNESRRLI
jgi:hypothetical protein